MLSENNKQPCGKCYALVALILVIGGMIAAGYSQHPHNQSEPDWGFWVAVVTAIALFIQCGIFWWQGRQLSRTVSSAEKAERAYLWMEKVSVTNLRSSKNIQCVIKNSGRTPGYVAQIQMGHFVGDTLPDQIADRSKFDAYFLLSPNAKFMNDGLTLDLSDDAVVSKIIDGGTKLFLLGCVIFDDMFEGRCCSGFAYETRFNGTDNSTMCIAAVSNPKHWEFTKFGSSKKQQNAGLS